MSSAGRLHNVADIQRYARDIRLEVVRMIALQGQGYVAQGLGAADLFAAIYFAEMRLDPADPSWQGRDRFFLSTAHNSAAFHATLAVRGLIERSALETYCKDGSTLEINVSERLGPLVESTSGSLGQGMSVAVGTAVYAKRRGLSHRCYVMLGDGEMQEGQVWEAAMSAANYKLDNLCVVVDLNHMQVEGHTDNAMKMAPVADKWRAFGWSVLEIDGHSIPEILGAFEAARSVKDKPAVIIARTVPGKGVSAIEGQLSHFMRMSPELAESALRELA
ncbi:MAG: transketolase [Rhizobiaceae bacterium]|nr:transketolase [Rhizobiaceae bacterium]